jgi:hypothetical protein
MFWEPPKLLFEQTLFLFIPRMWFPLDSVKTVYDSNRDIFIDMNDWISVFLLLTHLLHGWPSWIHVSCLTMISSSVRCSHYLRVAARIARRLGCWQKLHRPSVCSWSVRSNFQGNWPTDENITSDLDAFLPLQKLHYYYFHIISGNCWCIIFITNLGIGGFDNSEVWNMGYCWTREVHFFLL